MSEMQSPTSLSASAPGPLVATTAPSQQIVPPDVPLLNHVEGLNEDLTAGEWPSFDVAGFEDFGLSDPFVDGRAPFGLPQPSHEPQAQYPPSLGMHDRQRIPTVHIVPVCETPIPSATAAATDQEDRYADALPSASSSKRFLQTYYRISQPGQVSGLTDEDFVNYYFHNVCTIYSCFDSPQNPFRTLVADTWTSSATIYLAIQSMAAGHLANHYPSLAPLGLRKRSQAWRYLQKDLQLHRVGQIPTETVLLSLLLLGPSSPWHQASNLGMQFLFIARNLMQNHLRESVGRASLPELEQEEFFHEALMRWEMVASFVDPVPFTALGGNMQLPEQRLPHSRQRLFPHPWTGVAPEIHFAVAEVGRMLRRRRTHPNIMPTTPQTSSSAHITAADDEWVKSLESFLHQIELPGTDDIANYEDVRTPSADLVMTADALRFVGLLEIYDVLPGLLQQHAHNDTELSGFAFATASDAMTQADSLTAMAMHTLETVKPIAITSAACRFLPFILLVAGCRLKLAAESSDQEQDEVVQVRYLVEARMLLLSRKYPQKPILQMLDIIKEVWQRLDQGGADAHWLDVADEKGWQTLMG